MRRQRSAGATRSAWSVSVRAASPRRACWAIWPRSAGAWSSSATFAVTQMDYDVPSMIGMFGSPEIVRNSVRASERSGTLEGRALAGIFSALRPDDLIWNYWVGNNLLGDDPSAFDVMAWNADSTALPAALHAQFLDIFLHNSLAAGGLTVLGAPIDLAKVTCDTMVVGGRTDHLVPWKACYANCALFGGATEFVLSSSGHIQMPGQPSGIGQDDDHDRSGNRARPRRLAAPRPTNLRACGGTGGWSGRRRVRVQSAGRRPRWAAGPTPLSATRRVTTCEATEGAGGDHTMMGDQLNAWFLFDPGPSNCPDAEVISRGPDGSVRRTTYARDRAPDPATHARTRLARARPRPTRGLPGLEQQPAPRGVLRRPVHGPRPPHAQRAAVRRGAGLHHRRRRRPAPPGRPGLRPAARAGGTGSSATCLRSSCSTRECPTPTFRG